MPSCPCGCHGVTTLMGADVCACECPDGLDAYVRMGQEASCYGDGRRRTRYRTVVVDPPWKFSNNLSHYLYRADREGRGRGAAANYDVMELEEMMALPVARWAEPDAHLYLWTANAFMEEAHHLARAWGFQKKTILTWIKPRLGMGTYYRNNTEHVVFAVRGSLPTLRKDVPTAFTGAQGRHSEKPAAFYDMVETVSPGPRLDVFARKLRFGWDAWGNEVSSDGSIVHGPQWEPAAPPRAQPPAPPQQSALMEPP